MGLQMYEDWGQYRLWDFMADMKSDGALTISDIWLWFKWLYFMPGDSLISNIGPTNLGRFLEMGPHSYGGFGSGVMSLFLWLLLIHVVATAYEKMVALFIRKRA